MTSTFDHAEWDDQQIQQLLSASTDDQQQHAEAWMLLNHQANFNRDINEASPHNSENESYASAAHSDNSPSPPTSFASSSPRKRGVPGSINLPESESSGVDVPSVIDMAAINNALAYGLSSDPSEIDTLTAMQNIDPAAMSNIDPAAMQNIDPAAMAAFRGTASLASPAIITSPPVGSPSLHSPGLSPGFMPEYFHQHRGLGLSPQHALSPQQQAAFRPRAFSLPSPSLFPTGDPYMPAPPPVAIPRARRSLSSALNNQELQILMDEALLKVDFEDITVSELKELLRQRNKSASGKKAVLMQRLRSEKDAAMARRRADSTPGSTSVQRSQSHQQHLQRTQASHLSLQVSTGLHSRKASASSISSISDISPNIPLTPGIGHRLKSLQLSSGNVTPNNGAGSPMSSSPRFNPYGFTYMSPRLSSRRDSTDQGLGISLKNGEQEQTTDDTSDDNEWLNGASFAFDLGPSLGSSAAPTWTDEAFGGDYTFPAK